MRVKRIVILSILSGVITILCHAAAYAPLNSINPANLYPGPAFSERDVKTIYAYLMRGQGGKPSTFDDYGTTLEETSVTINVLSNDKEKSDDEDDAIDPATVDLEPQTGELDQSITTSSGKYDVDASGEVTYIPALNFVGNSIIRYTVRDRDGRKSNESKLAITVSNVNDPPVITGQTPNPLITDEDQSIVIEFSNLVVTDPDDNYPTDFTMSVSSGSNYTVSGTTITPDAEYSGILTVPVTVNDGDENSNTYDVQVQVASVNDAPVITGQTPDPVIITEDQSVKIELGNLIVTDVDDTYPNGFTLQIANGGNYTVNGTTVTPAANFSGTLAVSLTVNDGEDNSDNFNFQISVTAVNDAPVIAGQNPDPLTTVEEEPITIQLSHLVITDPDDTDFMMTVSEGTNYTLSGTTVSPAVDFEGTLSVPVTINDGEASSNTFSLQILVTGSNDIPIITSQSPLSVSEDHAITVILSNLEVTDNDNTYPDDFTLTLSSGSNYSVSVTTITPAANYYGNLTVPAVVNDGLSNSAPFDLLIAVDPVNDIPEITGQSTLTISEGQSISLDLSQLTVNDPDNSYPAGFTLSIFSGTNYTVSGSTVTPALGFNGVLSVGVLVNDGVANSAVYDLQVTVTPVNDPPVITGQTALTVEEDNALMLQLSNLTVTDADNSFPTDFSLAVLDGTNYTVSGNTITPSSNFTGDLSVGVQVNDGTINSVVYNLVVTVTPVNDAPVITGQQTLTTNEDQALTIELTHLSVDDPDNTYSTGFTLLVFSGSDYTLEGNTITPAPDYNGTLSVPVQVNDGQLNSNIYELQVQVTALNDAPVITGQTPLSTEEDTPVTIQLSHLTVMDDDNTYPSGFTLNVSAGTNYTVSGSTITPLLDFNGTLNISVTVNDGINNSEPFIFQIQVGDSNDPPVITGQVALSTNEEESLTIKLADLTVTDPDNSYPNDFSLLVSPGDNFTVTDNTITPALNFAGTLTIPVRVNDGVNNSATYDLKVSVNQINDPPSFDAIANQEIAENAEPSALTLTGISKGPGEDDQQIIIVATSGNTAIIPDPVITFNSIESTAKLTYILMPNASGLVTITVVATDNGSNVSPNQNSYTASFQIDVTEINSAPTLDAISDVTVAEDAGLQNISLNGITAGAGESQPLSFEISSDNPDLFKTLLVVYNAGETTGTLQIQSAENAYGKARVTVKITDNGSSTSPSVNFVSRTFTFTALAANDPPVFISVPVLLAAVNEFYEYNIETSDIENGALTFSALAKPSWATLANSTNGKAKLSGTPPPGAAGTSLIRILVKDGDITVEQQFSLIVNTRPTVDEFVIQLDEDASYTFEAQKFAQAYHDADQNAMQSIQITQKPGFGRLLLSDQEIKANDTIPASSLSMLVYKPVQDFDGTDAFYWKGFDGYHLSQTPAAAEIKIIPINDAPIIILETDSLHYEVNGEPAALTTLLTIYDPDDDSLSHADIAFKSQNYQPEFDQLIFQNTANVKGIFDFQSGKISLNGKAPLTEYEQAIRSIQYNHLNTLDPDLKLKTVSILANDGKISGDPKDRFIELKYTFIGLEIPTGFTPNGDHANDTWIITRPGGLEQLEEAIIKVYNKRGVMVFVTEGFDHPWDGTMNGEILPSDSYFFTIDLKLKSKRTYKGIVTILR